MHLCNPSARIAPFPDPSMLTQGLSQNSLSQETSLSQQSLSHYLIMSPYSLNGLLEMLLVTKSIDNAYSQKNTHGWGNFEHSSSKS